MEDNNYSSNMGEDEEAKPLKEKIVIDHKNNSKQNIRRLYKDAVNNITVEPSMFIFAVTSMVTMLASQNLCLDKACRVDLNLSDEICSDLRLQNVERQNNYERETQKLFAAALAWKTYLIASVPAILSLFIGTWSDKTGKRKVFLIIAVAGQLIGAFNDIVHTYFLTKSDIKALSISEALIDSLSGGWCVYTLASYSYISTITTEETRTFRMGVISFCYTVGYPIGSCIAGVLLKKIGFYGCFGLSLILTVVNLLYIMLYVKDAERSPEQKKHDDQGLSYFLRTFFDFTLIKQIFKVVTRRGPNRRRLRFCALLAIINSLWGPTYVVGGDELPGDMHHVQSAFGCLALVGFWMCGGELTVMYMTTRYRYNWDEVNYSIYQSYYTIIHTIGTLGSVTLLSKMWKWDDSLLGIIATVSKIAGSIAFCFATNGSIFYLAPLVEMLSGTAQLAANSIASKLVTQEELGKANSVIVSMENLTPIIYVPLYTNVYTATMELLPGAVFLVGTSLTLPAVAVFSWMFYEHRKSLKSKTREETQLPLNS